MQANQLDSFAVLSLFLWFNLFQVQFLSASCPCRNETVAHQGCLHCQLDSNAVQVGTCNLCRTLNQTSFVSPPPWFLSDLAISAAAWIGLTFAGLCPQYIRRQPLALVNISLCWRGWCAWRGGTRPAQLFGHVLQVGAHADDLVSKLNSALRQSCKNYAKCSSWLIFFLCSKSLSMQSVSFSCLESKKWCQNLCEYSSGNSMWCCCVPF